MDSFDDKNKLQYLVLDSGAIIKGSLNELYHRAHNIVTISEVLAEIRDSKSREALNRLPYEIPLMSPSAESIGAVIEFARKSGNLAALSRTDLRVLALTYMLEKQVNGASFELKHPSADEKAGAASEAAIEEKATATPVTPTTHPTVAAADGNTVAVVDHAGKPPAKAAFSWAATHRNSSTADTSGEVDRISLIENSDAVEIPDSVIDLEAFPALSSATVVNNPRVHHAAAATISSDFSAVDSLGIDEVTIEILSSPAAEQNDSKTAPAAGSNIDTPSEGVGALRIECAGDDPAAAEHSKVEESTGAFVSTTGLISPPFDSPFVSAAVVTATPTPTPTQQVRSQEQAQRPVASVIGRGSFLDNESEHVITKIQETCDCGGNGGNEEAGAVHTHKTHIPAGNPLALEGPVSKNKKQGKSHNSVPLNAQQPPVSGSSTASTVAAAERPRMTSNILYRSGLGSGAGEAQKLASMDSGVGWINKENIRQHRTYGAGNYGIPSVEVRARKIDSSVSSAASAAGAAAGVASEFGAEDGFQVVRKGKISGNSNGSISTEGKKSLGRRKGGRAKATNPGVKGLRSSGSVQVACVTTDFSMQNVLLQMSLHVYSIDGLQIQSVKSWVLRCMACFHVHNDDKMDRLFCYRCGANHLSRVAVSIDDSTGELKLHLKKNYHVDTRGTKYALPAPGKQDRYQGEILLREDQLLAGIWKQKVVRIRKDMKSAFGEDVTSDLGMQVNKSNLLKVGLGNKSNPNAMKGRERRGKKK